MKITGTDLPTTLRGTPIIAISQSEIGTSLKVNDDTSLAVLNTIATNTANINVNVGDVEVNTQDLEALQATTNTN